MMLSKKKKRDKKKCYFSFMLSVDQKMATYDRFIFTLFSLFSGACSVDPRKIGRTMARRTVNNSRLSVIKMAIFTVLLAIVIFYFQKMHHQVQKVFDLRMDALYIKGWDNRDNRFISRKRETDEHIRQIDGEFSICSVFYAKKKKKQGKCTCL